MDQPRRKGIFASLFELLGEEYEDPDLEPRDRRPPVAQEPVAQEPPIAAEAPGAGAGYETQAPTEPEPEYARAVVTTEADAGVVDVPAEPPADVPAAPAPPAVPEPAPADTPAEPTPGGQRLTSPVPQERLDALRELAGSLRDDAAAAAVVDRLLHDPEAAIRLEALRLLAGGADLPDPDVIRRVLNDPADPVRAEATRFMSAYGPAAIGDLTKLVGLRRSPVTQRAALDALPALIAASGADDAQLTELLERIARLDSPALAPERSGFAALARTCGRDRLVRALGLPEQLHRIGAARLLVEEGSAEALEAVAGLGDDELEEVRVAAALARSMLKSVSRDADADGADRSGDAAPVARRGSYAERPGDVAPPVPPDVPPRTSSISAQTKAELLTGLARALADTEESVRARSREALARANPRLVSTWVRDQLRSGDHTAATSAALVVEALGLRESSADLLERAASLPVEMRGTFSGALADLGLDPATLAGLTSAVEASRRPDAIRIVGEIGGGAVVPHLKPFLSDSSGPVRMAALEVVGTAPDADVLDLARSILERDSSPAVRAAAVNVVRRAENDDARLGALMHALDDPDPDVRTTAVEALLGEDPVPASPLLLKAVADDDERVRLAASRYLIDLRHDPNIVWTALLNCSDAQREDLLTIIEDNGSTALAALASAHIGSTEPSHRALAIALAGRAGTPESIRQTIAALKDPAVEVRKTATASLSQVRTPEAIPALAHALKDPEPQVRAGAVRALGVIDDDDVISVLIAALKDPEPGVRDQASAVLQRWRSPAVARRLVESLRTPDLARPVGDLLALMGSTALEPLLEQLESTQTERLPLIGELLGAILGPEPFVGELSALEPRIRSRAVEALGAIGGPKAVDGLIRALTDPDEAIRRRALFHLGALGDRRAYDAVRRTFTTDPVTEVVEAAEEALRTLGPGSVGPAAGDQRS